MNHLYLIRHGENTANVTREFSHRKVDYSLTPRGILQAQQTAGYLADKGLQEIYASPLKRAIETAQIIAGRVRLPVTVVEDFREVNVGDLEGMTPTQAIWAFHDSIVQGWLDGHPELRFPNGEDLHDLVKRASGAFESILREKDGRTLAIVSHGGIISWILPTLCGWENNDILRRGSMPNCSITEVEAGLVDGKLKMKLIRYADASHISGAAIQPPRPPLPAGDEE